MPPNTSRWTSLSSCHCNVVAAMPLTTTMAAIAMPITTAIWCGWSRFGPGTGAVSSESVSWVVSVALIAPRNLPRPLLVG